MFLDLQLFVTGECTFQVGRNLAKLFEGYTPALVDQLLNDPQHSVCIFVSQLRPWVSTASRTVQYGAFALSICGNYASTSAQRLLYKRLCFYSGDPPSPGVISALPGEVEFHPLTPQNFHSVLHATAAIPFRVAPPDHMPGVGPGLFVDGGLGDYMVNSHMVERPALLVSHTPRVQATWMDTLVPYRSPPQSVFDNLSVLFPSPEFVRALPGGRLPSVRDWETYVLCFCVRSVDIFWLLQASQESQSSHRQLAADHCAVTGAVPAFARSRCWADGALATHTEHTAGRNCHGAVAYSQPATAQASKASAATTCSARTCVVATGHSQGG